MGSRIHKGLLLFTVSLILLCSLAASASAVEVAVANSEDWVEVYSVLLHASLNKQKAYFVNADAVQPLTKVLSLDTDILMYESSDSPYIQNLNAQMSSLGYNVETQSVGSDMNVDLAPDVDTYYVVSRDNPRITLSLASLAVRQNAWVFIVDENNVNDVVASLTGATTVIGVGNFGRDVLDQLEPSFTRRINNNDLFKDSQAIAKEFGDISNVVLADGAFLESEFFTTGNPVLLSGSNKVLDDTISFFKDNNVQSVVIVGNQLSVVGEQIRTNTNKQVSVFVKFGQSDISNTGRVYALTLFPLPQPQLGLTVQKVVYNPVTKELIAWFNNLGNTGIYELTTLSVKNGDDEVGTASFPDVVFIGAGELLPVTFPIELPVEELNDDTLVEFYTSYGLYPSQLDTFLTMTNQFGPPFSIGLTVEEIGEDDSLLSVEDVAYYSGLKRMGVTVINNGTARVYYTTKINGLIVNGLEEDLFKEDYVEAGQVRTTYMPVELDEVDLEENREVSLLVTYGSQEDLLLKTIQDDYPFKVVAGNALTGLVTGVFGENASVGVVVVVIVVVIALVVLIVVLRKRGGSNGGSGAAPKRVATKAKATKKKSAKKAAKKKAAKRRR